MPKLIINADDLGIHPSIDEGIRQAYIKGVLTSATVFMTTPYVESAIEKVIKATEMPVGLHLSLTTGKCCAKVTDVPLLVDKFGNFNNTPANLIQSCQRNNKKELLNQIRMELTAQFERAEDLSLELSHFDAHQNFYFTPSIFEVLKEVAPKYGFTKARVGKEPLYAFTFFDQPLQVLHRKNPLKWLLTRVNISRIRHAFISTDHFFGIMYSGVMNRKSFLKFIRRLRAGKTYEAALHPGYPAPTEDAPYLFPAHNRFISSADRKQEYDILVDPELPEIIEARNIKLISYKDLN